MWLLASQEEFRPMELALFSTVKQNYMDGSCGMHEKDEECIQYLNLKIHLGGRC
jgi:hypothetical protein